MMSLVYVKDKLRYLGFLIRYALLWAHVGVSVALASWERMASCECMLHS